MAYLKLHVGEFVHEFAHTLPDECPRDLSVGLRGRLHGVTRQVVERHHVLQHAHCLVEGAESRGREKWW